MRKKIGIITIEYPLGVLSDVTSMAFSLEKEGFCVDIFIDKYMNNNAKIDFHNNNIKIFPIEAGSKKTGVFWEKRVFNFSFGGMYDFLTDKLADLKNLPFQKYSKHIRAPKSLEEKLFYHLKYFLPKKYKFAKHLKKYINTDYVCLLGVEPQGLVLATLVSSGKNIPVIYHNLELLLSNECNTKSSRILKKLEKECSHNCLFTIIQDKNRARYYVEDNKIDFKNIRFLPTSFSAEPYKNKTDYLYKKFNIPKDKDIILYAGNVSWPNMSLEIAQAAQKWKDNYVLVLHAWTKLSSRDKYASEIKKIIDNKKIYLSTEFLESDKLPEMLSCAKIGLIFYQNLGPNSYEIGFACTKLTRYLQAGLPVVSIDFPSLKEKIEGGGAGICVNSPELIEQACSKIMADYNNYRLAAFKLYEEKYNFSKNFKDILEEIKQLTI